MSNFFRKSVAIILAAISFFNGCIYDAPSYQKITGNELRRGGIKLWLYNTDKRVGQNEKLTVSFLDTLTSPGNPTTVSQFKINLNFKVMF